MEKLRNATLLFLVKNENNAVSDICLAMKKRGFGMGRWNGVGGKVNDGETIEEATKREANEEIGIDVQELNKVAELSFYFPHNPSWDQLVTVYTTNKWTGEPKESEEMKPEWFAVENIPFENMWPDDKFWLPQVLEGKLIKARFSFGEGDVIFDQDIQVVNSF